MVVEIGNNIPMGDVAKPGERGAGSLPPRLPRGKYTLVGIDIDTTGRRLIDEIVQLAAYTPKSHFEQYIMPYMNLNPAARQRHQVRVITIGFYRMLKCTQTYKIIKSKSEIVAIKDFLDWLEAVKKNDPGSNGIILVYHETRKFIPYMILESLKKYNLLDRFLETVKSFANGLNLAQKNLNGSTMQNCSLRKLSKCLTSSSSSSSVLLSSQSSQSSQPKKSASQSSSNGLEIDEKKLNNNNNELNNNVMKSKSENSLQKLPPTITDEKQPMQQQPQQKNSMKQSGERELLDSSASVRAKLVYDVVYHLTNQHLDKTLADNIVAMENMLNAIHQYASPISYDLEELEMQAQILERQNSFRPVFYNYFKTTLYHRVRAVKFRIVLAENGYDLQTLNAIWSEKRKEGLAECIQAIDELKQEDKTELIDLLDSFYDPSKKTIKPIVKANRRKNRRPSHNKENENTNPQHGSGDKPQANQVDSTTKTPSKFGAGAKPQRSRRSARSRRSSLLRQQNNSGVSVLNTTTVSANI